MVRSIYGTVGGDLLAFAGRGISGRESEPSDILIVGTLFQRGGEIPVNPESIQELYDAFEKANVKSASSEETEAQEQKRLLLGDAVKVLSALRTIENVTKEREKRHKITDEMIRISKAAVSDEDQFFIPPYPKATFKIPEWKKQRDKSLPDTINLSEESMKLLIDAHNAAAAAVSRAEKAWNGDFKKKRRWLQDLYRDKMKNAESQILKKELP